MKLEKGKTKISIEDKLATDLLELIKNKHKSLIRLGNSELIMLFWHIGNKLNKYFESIEGIELEKSVIKSISTRLAAKYGSFFLKGI